MDLYVGKEVHDVWAATFEVLWEVRAKTLKEECRQLLEDIDEKNPSLFFNVMALAHIGNDALRGAAKNPFTTCVSKYEGLGASELRTIIIYNLI